MRSHSIEPGSLARPSCSPFPRAHRLFVTCQVELRWKGTVFRPSLEFVHFPERQMSADMNSCSRQPSGYYDLTGEHSPCIRARLSVVPSLLKREGLSAPERCLLARFSSFAAASVQEITTPVRNASSNQILSSSRTFLLPRRPVWDGLCRSRNAMQCFWSM